MWCLHICGLLLVQIALVEMSPRALRLMYYGPTAVGNANITGTRTSLDRWNAPSSERALMNGCSVTDWDRAAQLSAESYRGNRIPNRSSTRSDKVVVEDERRRTSAVIHLIADSRIIFVAFRGTNNREDVAANLKSWPSMSADKSFRGSVHAGFLSSYKALHERITSELSHRLASFDSIVVTGHSLGGAIATIAVPILKNLFRFKEIDCITFGAPRVGNKRFGESFRQAVRSALRFVTESDPVAKLPPKGYYYHVSSPWILYEGCVTHGSDKGSKRTKLSKWPAISGHFLQRYSVLLKSLRRDVFDCAEQCYSRQKL